MKIFILWGQRKCRYEGEYAPELLVSVDEVTQDVNPDYLKSQFDKYYDSKEFSSIAISQSYVSDNLIDAILNPQNELDMLSFTKVK